jgi:hypothetical protein
VDIIVSMRARACVRGARWLIQNLCFKTAPGPPRLGWGRSPPRARHKAQ